MSSFLLDDGHFLCDVPLNDDGARNLLYLINILEEVVYVLEYPEDSICWLTYHNDRLDGVQPDDKVFPRIVKKYFQMMVADFFNRQITDDKFMASLCYEQVKHVYGLVLYFESSNNL